MNFVYQCLQKLQHCRQTDTQSDVTECINVPHSRVVTNQLTTTHEQQTTYIHSVKTESLHATTYPMAGG